MTDLVAPTSMDTKRAQAFEHWHAMVMGGDLIASVVVTREADATWTARTQLRDRSLMPRGDCRKSAPFDTHEAALHAGQAAASRLHKASVGMREVSERLTVLQQPPGGYLSQALKRYARAQQGAPAMQLPNVVPLRATEREMIA